MLTVWYRTACMQVINLAVFCRRPHLSLYPKSTTWRGIACRASIPRLVPTLFRLCKYVVFPVPGIGGVFQTARRHATGGCGVLLRGGHSLGMRGDRCECRRSVLASCLGPGLCDDTYLGAKWCSIFEQAKLIEVLRRGMCGCLYSALLYTTYHTNLFLKVWTIFCTFVFRDTKRGPPARCCSPSTKRKTRMPTPGVCSSFPAVAWPASCPRRCLPLHRPTCYTSG